MNSDRLVPASPGVDVLRQRHWRSVSRMSTILRTMSSPAVGVIGQRDKLVEVRLGSRVHAVRARRASGLSRIVSFLTRRNILQKGSQPPSALQNIDQNVLAYCVAIGPKSPLVGRSNAASRLPYCSHSCRAQHTHCPNGGSADKPVVRHRGSHGRFYHFTSNYSP